MNLSVGIDLGDQKCMGLGTKLNRMAVHDLGLADFHNPSRSIPRNAALRKSSQISGSLTRAGMGLAGRPSVGRRARR